MYCTHYKFSEKPFDVTPDPRFLYLTEGHRETLASLIYGIRERRGFITIVGEVGTGKTTLLNAALDRLDDKTRVAFIFNTDVNFDEMLSMALYEWGLIKSQESLSKVNAVQRLNDFAIEQLAKGGNVVLIVDEAQNLDNSVMENLRLLSNLETRKHKLVQIVLSGQPELDTKLGRYELRQLAQRISLRRYVFPLDEKDTYAYLEHRLKVAKHKNSSPFTDKAQKLIWEYSGGVPRKINILCDNAFLIGYGLKKNTINSAIVQEAAQDLKWHRFSDTKASSNVPPAETGFTWVETKPSRRPLKLTAAMIIAGLLIFAGSFLLLVPQSDTTKQAVITQKINAQEVPKKDIEPETRIKNDEVSYLAISKYHLLNEKSLDLIVQDLSLPEAQVDDKEKSNPSIPVKEEEIIRHIVVKKGDTIYRIIVQTYGAYDDVILNKVQRQNPKIIDPDIILAGQVIKLPVNKK